MAFEIFKLIGSIFVDTEQANKSIQKTDENAEGLGKRFLSGVGTVAKWGAGIAAAAGTAAVAAGTALVAVTENTREYRTEMGKLETAYTTAGHSTEAATNTYRALQSILGETDQSVEAANHLAKLCTTEEELQRWTDICTGVYATFGDSLPIEGLAEAANETAKVGQVTGAVADALNWAGVSEDEFNAKLEKCTSEQERQALITETLNGLYSEASDTYKEVNKDIISSNAAQEKMNAAMARLGAVAEPVIAQVKSGFADMIDALLPFAEMIAANVIPPLMQIIQTILPILIGFITSLIEFLAPVGEQLIAFFNQMSGSVSDTGLTFTSVFSTIQEAFSNIWLFMQDIWDTVGVPIFTYIQQIVGTVAEYFSQKMPEISSLFQKMATDISQLWENNLKPCFAAIVDILNNVVAPVFDFVFNTMVVPVLDSAFQAISDLWENTLKPVFTGITDFLTGVFTGNWEQAFNGLSSIVEGAFNGLEAAVKYPLNAVIGIINNFIRKVNTIKVPDWVPDIGGKGINIREIPLLARGGNIIKPGAAIVGDAGPELLELPAGARVTPLGSSALRSSGDERTYQLLEKIYAFLYAILPELANQQMVLDSGVLVGQMASAMDRQLEKIHKAVRRGN